MSSDSSLSPALRTLLQPKVENELKKITGEEPDVNLLDYLLLLVSSGRSESDIRTDLIEFFDKEGVAAKIAAFLTQLYTIHIAPSSLPPKSSVPAASAKPTEASPSKRVSLKRGRDDSNDHHSSSSNNTKKPDRPLFSAATGSRASENGRVPLQLQPRSAVTRAPAAANAAPSSTRGSTRSLSSVVVVNKRNEAPAIDDSDEGAAKRPRTARGRGTAAAAVDNPTSAFKITFDGNKRSIGAADAAQQEAAAVAPAKGKRLVITRGGKEVKPEATPPLPQPPVASAATPGLRRSFGSGFPVANTTTAAAAPPPAVSKPAPPVPIVTAPAPKIVVKRAATAAVQTQQQIPPTIPSSFLLPTPAPPAAQVVEEEEEEEEEEYGEEEEMLVDDEDMNGNGAGGMQQQQQQQQHPHQQYHQQSVPTAFQPQQQSQGYFMQQQYSSPFKQQQQQQQHSHSSMLMQQPSSFQSNSPLLSHPSFGGSPTIQPTAFSNNGSNAFAPSMPQFSLPGQQQQLQQILAQSNNSYGGGNSNAATMSSFAGGGGGGSGGQENHSSALGSSSTKCRFFPNCTNNACPYFHPTTLCTFFPNCTRGDACLNLHPSVQCKFGNKCTNASCTFTHPSGHTVAAGAAAASAESSSSSYRGRGGGASSMRGRGSARGGGARGGGGGRGGGVTNMLTLANTPCRYGSECTREDCIYSHPAGHSLSHSSLDVSAPFAAGNNNPNPSFHAFGSSSAFGNTAPQPARNAHEVAQALAMRMTQSQAMA